MEEQSLTCVATLQDQRQAEGLLALPPAKVVAAPSSRLVLAQELKGLTKSKGKQAAPSGWKRLIVSMCREQLGT